MQARELLKNNAGIREKVHNELFALEGYHRNSGTGVLAEVRKKNKP
jgi:hypothetical protein